MQHREIPRRLRRVISMAEWEKSIKIIIIGLPPFDLAGRFLQDLEFRFSSDKHPKVHRFTQTIWISRAPKWAGNLQNCLSWDISCLYTLRQKSEVKQNKKKQNNKKRKKYLKLIKYFRTQAQFIKLHSKSECTQMDFLLCFGELFLDISFYVWIRTCILFHFPSLIQSFLLIFIRLVVYLRGKFLSCRECLSIQTIY